MRSDLMKKGVERAPHRSLFKAMGYTDEEIARPLIGVVNSYNEIIPGHIHLRTITEHVKAGIRMAGGTPVTAPEGREQFRRLSDRLGGPPIVGWLGLRFDGGPAREPLMRGPSNWRFVAA